MANSVPITINYQETAFTLPWNRNHQRIHDQVYQVLLAGTHIDSDSKTRTFVYDAVPLDQEESIGLVTARSSSFLAHVDAENKQFVVRDGDKFSIRLSLAASLHNTYKIDEKEMRSYRRVLDDELQQWATTLLQRHGMSSVELDVMGRSEYSVNKPRVSFRVPKVRVEATVVVDDAAAFAKAFLSGVGRQKGYGLGLVELVEK